MLRAQDLDYHLPQRLIATRPAEPRDASRLLVISRSDPARLEHRRFAELTDFLTPDDLLVFNASAVVPARIAARRADSGGAVEGLFLTTTTEGHWRLLLKSNGRLRPGLDIILHDPHDNPTDHRLQLLQRDEDAWIAKPTPTLPAADILARVGATPLPPYILSARKAAHQTIDDDLDQRWYQTVYADKAHPGSVAAPTAGLHFTPDLLEQIHALGTSTARVLLHVGAGTFKPITTPTADEHPIHSERISVPADTIKALTQTPGSGGRRICVGTTTVRAVESIPNPTPVPNTPFETDTSLFILPGFDFQFTDALITNFHLPRSTLLALVGALLDGGVPRLLDIYAHAIEHEYRFYSYGDAMLILP